MSALDIIVLVVASWIVLAFCFLVWWVAIHPPRDSFDQDHSNRERVGLH